MLFYSENISNDIIYLTPEETHHCLKALRKKCGDQLKVTDGKGNIYDCEIIDDTIKTCKLQIKEILRGIREREYELNIAIAPTKNINRFEWFMEKSTEIGISGIIPLLCEHSERKSINKERLNKILISAMKQSYSSYLPVLHEMTEIKNLISKEKDSGKYIAICDKEIKTEHLKEAYKKKTDAIILIGPEGDFSKEEIMFAISKGYKPVSLSSNRLRTETAGILACSIINVIND